MHLTQEKKTLFITLYAKALRKEFYSTRPGYHMIASSVTAPDWINDLPKHRPALVIADGLLEYLEPTGRMLKLTDWRKK